MRVICDTQLRLEFYQSNSKMSKKLEVGRVGIAHQLKYYRRI